MISLVKQASTPYTNTDGSISSSYWDFATIHFAGGKRCTAFFDKRGSVVKWYAAPIGDAC